MIIEAKDFAGKSNGGYQFGIADRESIIRGLLKVVGGLIDFSLLPQSIALNAKIGIDDYLLHDLTITYAENNEPSESAKGTISDDTLNEFFENLSKVETIELKENSALEALKTFMEKKNGC